MITITFVTYGQKDFYNGTLIKPLFIKHQIFTKLPQILHFHTQKNNFYSWNLCNFMNFMAEACKEHMFSNLPVVSH